MSIVGYIVKGALMGCLVGMVVDSGNNFVQLYRLHKQKTEAIDNPVQFHFIGLSLKYMFFGATLGGLYGTLRQRWS